MKYIVFIISMIAGITMSAQQLKQIQKGTDRNQIPVTNGYQNTQVYRNAIPYILDTLGIRDSICCLDSIYFSSGRVYLRDGSGSALIPVPSVTETISGHQIGVFNPGGGVNVPIRETVTTFSSIASGVRTYTSEDGTQYDLDAESTNELQELTLLDSTNRVFLLEISNGNFVKWKDEVGGGATQYLNPYIIGGDTVGFYLTVAQDTVLFLNTIDTASYCCPPSIGNDTLYIGDYYVVLPSGEATTVGDTPTINMTLTGVNITGEVIDGSITPAKLDRTYLETEVDGSTTNEIELPSQTGNSGKYLSTNGTSPSWETVSGGGSSKVIDILGTDFTTSATSLQSTALSYTFPSTGTYEIKVYGSYTCSNTANGIGIGFIDSGGLVASYITGKHAAFNNNSSSSSTEFRKPISAIGTTLATASVNASSTPYTLISETLITVSTAGTITYGFASGSGSHSATLQAGSSLVVEKLN